MMEALGISRGKIINLWSCALLKAESPSLNTSRAYLHTLIVFLLT